MCCHTLSTSEGEPIDRQPEVRASNELVLHEHDRTTTHPRQRVIWILTAAHRVHSVAATEEYT